MKRFILLSVFLVCTLIAFGQEEQSFIYDDKGKRDPFLPLVGKDGRFLLDTGLTYSFDELELSGILWDPQGKSSALINDQIVTRGESVYGFKIKTITKDSVIFSKEGKEYILKLSIEKGD